MAIWVNRTRRDWSFRALPARRVSFTPWDAVTTAPQVVAGVTPGKGGQTVEGIPVFRQRRGGA